MTRSRSPTRVRATITPASPAPATRVPSSSSTPPTPVSQPSSRSPSVSRRASASSVRDGDDPRPRPSTSAALVSASLGLLAVPPGDFVEGSGTSSDSGWPTRGLESGNSSAVSLASNDGAGFVGDGGTDTLGGSSVPELSRSRKISFGLLERGSNASGAQHASTVKATEPTPRKLSGPQRFIKRARSFGQLGSTSPGLPSSPTFASTSRLPPSPPVPSPTTEPAETAPRRPSTSSNGKGAEPVQPLGMPSPNPSTSSAHWLFQPVVQAPNSKGKEKEVIVDQDGTGIPGGRRKSTLALRRSTFSIFRRNDSQQRTSGPPSPVVPESPAAPPISAVPPLPSLPSLQLSGSPYRMSWGFGNGQALTTSSAPTSPPATSHAVADLPLTSSPLGSPTRSPRDLRPDNPPFRRATSADSPTLRRNGSWTGSQRSDVAASPSSDYAALGLWLERNGSSVTASPPARQLLRAGRSNSDGLTRNYSLGSLPSFSAEGSKRSPRSPSGPMLGTAGGSTPPLPAVRPPSPLKVSTSTHERRSGGLGRRPTTADSSTDGGREGRGGVFGAVSGFFSGASSSNMSRSSSNSSAATIPHVETSEFGALFGGSPAKGRKRGLSVGNGIFGSSSIDSRKRAGSTSSLSNSWVPATGGLLVPTPDGGTTPTGQFTRTRASTDPRRTGSSTPYDPQASYFPPHGATTPAGSGGLGLSSQSSQSAYPFPSPPDSPANSRRPSSVLSRPSTSPSLSVSRKASFSQPSQPQQGRSRSSSVKFEVLQGETPEAFVQRMLATLSKGDVSRVCASNSDSFFAEALTAYLATFDFASDPLDIALRKFLMEASLPTETQQIDRVMEAFAVRYNHCNPGLFATSDTPYVLAFSLVMLSTDQFNPSNKNKMTRADYVRNTKIEGVAIEVLEYLFDQITITPFVFSEDANEFGVLRPEMYTTSGSFFSKSTSSSVTRSKFDPYHLISMGTTRDLRLDVESLIPPRSPFSFTGTTSFFNATTLHQLFVHAPVLQVTSRPRSKSSAGGLADAASGAPLEPITSNTTFVQPQKEKVPTISSLKITKIGLLSRKEDLAEGGKKAASRKWKGWSVVLTGSQLLFFKDPSWAEMLQQTLKAAAASQIRPDDSHVLVFSIQTPFKPDAVLSLANSAAIYDATYAKYSNVFRLVAPAGRQFLFQATTPAELNSWLHAINYAASFKSADLRIRPLTPRLRSSDPPATTLPSAPPSPRPADLPLPPSPAPQHSTTMGSLAPSTTSASSEPLTATEIDGLQRNLSSVTEEDFTLPADLRQSLSSNPPEDDVNSGVEVELLAESAKVTADSARERDAAQAIDASNIGQEALKALGPSRGDVLRSKIAALENEIRSAKSLLQTDLRLARNFAVLTPFRSSTRERLQLALQPLEKRVRYARMNLAKLVCHREVLSRDLLVEDRESRPARHGSQRRRNSSRPSSPSQQTPRPPNHQWPSPLRARDRPPSPSDSDPRDSFDSAPENRTDFAARESVSDDELDRLRSAAPPLQRSHTETLWSSARPRAGTGISEDELPPTTRPSMESPSGSAKAIAGPEMSPKLGARLSPELERSQGVRMSKRQEVSSAWSGYVL